MFDIFLNKLPRNLNDLLPYNKTKVVTFLNPYTYLIAKKDQELYEVFDYIASDGFLPVWLLKINGIHTPRVSFDMTSLAPHIFKFAIKKKKKIFFIGSSNADIERFSEIISKSYPELSFESRHGFFSSSRERANMISELTSCNYDIIVVGMGAPLQEYFSNDLIKSGYSGSIYTCGGFFHQTTKKLNYYPKIINKFNLRFLYRMMIEPKVIKRAIYSVPKFTLEFLFIKSRLKK